MTHLKAILIGLALATPPVAAWVLRSDAHPPDPAALVEVSSPPQAIPSTTLTLIPVEVVSNGSEPEWIFVEAAVQSIPEPGVLPLTVLAALLLLRRKRMDARK